LPQASACSENRVQESKAKWPDLRARHAGLSLHLIGPLQSNKAKEAVMLFDAVHSLDRPSLCEALAKEIGKQGRAPQLFVEINTGAESQKAGILPEDADAFLRACREDYGLRIDGLMCIPPLDEAPAPHFADRQDRARNGLKLLSMGMKRGLRAVVRRDPCRVGSAIFGTRANHSPSQKDAASRDRISSRQSASRLPLYPIVRTRRIRQLTDWLQT
jgi:uncharacterized pyridoxal phosphate-containing UPF0001 family protein